MSEKESQRGEGCRGPKAGLAGMVRAAEVGYGALRAAGFSVIVFGALVCNVAVKLSHAVRYGLLGESASWMLSDIVVLVGVDVVLTVICWRWPSKRVVRGALVVAAIVFAWAVVNAAWVIRTGTQVVPMELWPLINDPVNTSWIVLVNLARRPGPAALLLAAGMIVAMFFLSAVRRAVPPKRSAKGVRWRVVVSLAVVMGATVGSTIVTRLGSTPAGAAGLQFNCQARAVISFVLPGYRSLGREDLKNATRELPRGDEIEIKRAVGQRGSSVVIVVLEGIQYDCTSLAAEHGGIAPQTGGRAAGLTPHLSTVAAQGACFPNARATVTHTSKALFALLTGRSPSASQDISETVPVDRPYASLATILRDACGYRTAFFQSAKGSFESRAGLLHNLGFGKFWAREDLADPNQFVGYLGSDEFAMLEPIADWIGSGAGPFLLVVLCSATHDPYEVPAWFGAGSKDHVERYLQAVAYTDRFLAALDAQLATVGGTDNMILCVAGDHGEAFGEHRIMGHERLAFEEVLRIALCLRAPGLIEPGTRIAGPVGSTDLTPTILGLLGFDTAAMGFDGMDARRPLPEDRRVFFSGWMQEGPAGFVQGDTKYVYDPDRGTVTTYRLEADPLELGGIELSKPEAERIGREIVAWRRATVFRPQADRKDGTILFGSWLWKPTGRVSRIK